MENKNELVMSDVAKVELVDQLKNPVGQFYCSIENDGTRASAVAIYNAVNGADDKLSNHIGDVLEIVNVVAHPVSLVNEETGEVFEALRTILIDKKGKTYTAVSEGITSALSRIFSIVGMPDGGAWEKDPVKMKIRQIPTGNGNNKVNTIELV